MFFGVVLDILVLLVFQDIVRLKKVCTEVTVHNLMKKDSIKLNDYIANGLKKNDFAHLGNTHICLDSIPWPSLHTGPCSSILASSNSYPFCPCNLKRKGNVHYCADTVLSSPLESVQYNDIYVKKLQNAMISLINSDINIKSLCNALISELRVCIMM